VRILYLGARTWTSFQRANALERLGHEVTIVDPSSFVPGNKWVKRFHWETGGISSQKIVTRKVLSEINSVAKNVKFDCIWVDSGRYVGPLLIKALKDLYQAPIVNYNLDDPYGTRDRYSWSLYKRSVRFYDLVVVVRKENVQEAKALGAKDVLLLKRVADEVAHHPRTISQEDRDKWASDVLFVGTWFPERGPFMAELVNRGVPLTIYGSRWQKAPEWPVLQAAWKGPELRDPDDYSRALQCSKIAMGLLSKGNRDLHTQRSSEIPAIGALFCAERTSEHLEMYEDGVEAVFWEDAEECAAVCKALLGDETKRLSIQARGAQRVIKNQAFNQPMMNTVLERLFNPKSA